MSGETLSILHSRNGDEDVKPPHHREGLSLLSTVFLMVGQLAGVGVLALPKALADTGWGGIVMILLSCIATGFSGILLGHCWNILLERYPEYRDHVRDPYPAIAERALGKWIGDCTIINALDDHGGAYASLNRSLTLVFVVTGVFGSSVLYILLAAENSHSLLGHAGVNLSPCLWMVIVAVILLPLSWFGSPKDFWFVGVLAAGTTITDCLLLLVSFMSQLSVKDPVSQSSVSSFTTVFLAFGTIVFSVSGIAVFPTFHHDMKAPSQFQNAIISGFSVILCIYLSTAIGGYYVHGDNSKANILLTLPRGGLRISIEVLLTVHLFAAFAININPIVQIFEKKLQIAHEFGVKRVVLRSITIIAILFVSETIPHFGGLVAFIGSSVGSFLTFVAPPVFYLRLCSQSGDWQERNLPLYQKIVPCLIIVVGIIGGIAGTYSAILELLSPDTFVPPCYINSSITGV